MRSNGGATPQQNDDVMFIELMHRGGTWQRCQTQL